MITNNNKMKVNQPEMERELERKTCTYIHIYRYSSYGKLEFLTDLKQNAKSNMI